MQFEFMLEKKETFRITVEADDLEEAHIEVAGVIDSDRSFVTWLHPDLEERGGSDDGWEILSVEPVAEEV